ncbi:hypothetical protein AIIKEEIJ_06227 [Rhodococcus sp. YH1]|nr:hypothetical protein [Rhodococcus sp. YH1]NCL78719.1 hypothetical protein [Rhodococcus sp. YH1]
MVWSTAARRRSTRVTPCPLRGIVPPVPEPFTGWARGGRGEGGAPRAAAAAFRVSETRQSYVSSKVRYETLWYDCGDIDRRKRGRDVGDAKGGRRREYASDAERVRAWRQRQKDKARADQQRQATPTDPASAITTLTEAVPLLRQEAAAAVDRLAEVARSITAATELLADPAALDAHLRRIQADADKVRADAGVEIAALREQLGTALDDRADADAAAAAAETAAADATARLEAARRDHEQTLHRLHAEHRDRLTALTAEHAAATERWQRQLDQAQQTHRAQVADLEHRIGVLTAQAEDHRDQLTRLRADADNAAAAAAATIERLGADLAAARAETAAERERTDRVRADLEAARTEAAAAHAQADAARERADELRAELREVRTATQAT